MTDIKIALGTSCVPPWVAYCPAAEGTVSGGFENENCGGGESE